ncbi:hypothetical protein AVEN_202225-1 [Araneus ventricosus]|uniref:Uncharacterized protein n=1 Tax=Araneus ventricosus TaxID=182803 RepID=A0A4Y2SEX9_ARAVE|nr:hypothetical protein AVEN_202225-1 [Araneus ventricosus]
MAVFEILVNFDQLKERIRQSFSQQALLWGDGPQWTVLAHSFNLKRRIQKCVLVNYASFPFAVPRDAWHWPRLLQATSPTRGRAPVETSYSPLSPVPLTCFLAVLFGFGFGY